MTRNCGMKKEDWRWTDTVLTSDVIDCKWPGPKEEESNPIALEQKINDKKTEILDLEKTMKDKLDKVDEA